MRHLLVRQRHDLRRTAQHYISGTKQVSRLYRRIISKYSSGVPRHGVWVGCSFLPSDTPCVREFSINGLQILYHCLQAMLPFEQRFPTFLWPCTPSEFRLMSIYPQHFLMTKCWEKKEIHWIFNRILRCLKYECRQARSQNFNRVANSNKGMFDAPCF